MELRVFSDGNLVGDLFPLCIDGLNWTKKLNGVGTLSAGVSLRKLGEFNAENNISPEQLFLPMRTSCILYDGGNVWGGWLSATPAFELTGEADTVARLEFVDWLGLLAGAYVNPPYSYSNNFNTVAMSQINTAINRSSSAGSRWQISAGVSQSLASVQGSVDAPKTVLDFILERADNETGTGNFDLISRPTGHIDIYQRYGYDMTETPFNYPVSDRTGLLGVSYPAWENFIGYAFLVGAGNGFGTGGTAITATSLNQRTIDNIGYFEYATSHSDISRQATLNSRATSYTRNTHRPFASPTLTIETSEIAFRPHEYGGQLFVGDEIAVRLSDYVRKMLPMRTIDTYRIREIEATVDKWGSTTAQLITEAP